MAEILVTIETPKRNRRVIKHGTFNELLGIEEPQNQAQRIIKKFGNARRLARLLKAIGYNYNPSSIYKWTYPRSPVNGRGGTGGIIPADAWPAIKKAAVYDGVVLTLEDIEPKEK